MAQKLRLRNREVTASIILPPARATGHTYTTYPGSRHLFPTLGEPTATLRTGEPPTVESTAKRGVMMPKRRHTRAHTTATAIAAERRLNDAYVADCYQPAPF